MNDYLEPKTWQQVRDDLHRVNKELTEIIDKINPSKTFKIYKARYRYGSEYVQSGKLFLPDKDGNLKHVGSPDIPNEVYNDLSYNLGSNPVSVILKKSIELYLPFPNRPEPIPYAVGKPGSILSTSGVLKHGIYHHHPAFLWNISAGSRTIFMLPKISKTKNYRKIQRQFGYNVIPPNSMAQHWSVFKGMSDANLLGEWFLETLFFSKKWFDEIDSPRFSNLKLYMQKSLHNSLGFWSSQHIWNSYFAFINNLAGIRPSAYAYDTVKHLILLGMGILPGMAPACNEIGAPISAIQDIYANVYKLEHYKPIIMQASHFNSHKKSHPVYYSLNYSNAAELAPKSTEYSSTIIDLYEIKNLLHLYLRHMSSDELNISKTVMSTIPKLVDFDFFHSTPENYIGIRSSDDIFTEDTRFSNVLCDIRQDKPNTNPSSSTFVRGCVRIKKSALESDA